MEFEADKLSTSCRAGETGRAALLRVGGERPRLADMAQDFELLAAELERVYGEERTLPNRAQLRAATRVDLEKARACWPTVRLRRCLCGKMLAHLPAWNLIGVCLGLSV